MERGANARCFTGDVHGLRRWEDIGGPDAIAQVNPWVVSVFGDNP